VISDPGGVQRRSRSAVNSCGWWPAHAWFVPTRSGMWGATVRAGGRCRAGAGGGGFDRRPRIQAARRRRRARSVARPSTRSGGRRAAPV